MTKFKESLLELLQNDERLFDEQGELKENLLRELIDQYDPKLLDLLLGNELTRAKFFVSVGKSLVFKANELKFFIDENKLDNSYTQFENKIGLKIGSRLLREYRDVVLNFPYKDCVLEGGQSTEEGTDIYFEYDKNSGDYEEKKAKRKEVFFNQVLAKDEIDRLFEPKAFANAKRYGGDSSLKFTRDENGTIKDNLIIKGNNLLALHTLKEEFRGKVKLIYIDPPYNTGNDTFAYNDNFNHSSWLVFMKNRLEVAKTLLMSNGVIFISCDDNEYTYLKCLCDEIFGIDAFENIFHFKVRHENRILRQDIRYQKVIEQALCYSMPDYKPNRVFSTLKNADDNYQFDIQINKEVKPQLEKINGYDVYVYKKKDYELVKSKKGNLKEYNIRGSLITQKGSASEFYELYLRTRKASDGLGTLYKVMKMGEKGDGMGFRFIRQPFDESGANGFYYQGKPTGQSEDKGNPFPNYYDFEKEFNNSANEGGIKFKNGKKPEMFLLKLFEIASIVSGDLVLDFHLGSGTTAALSHKLNCQYIGIEQLKYGENDSVVRLQNVINGEQSGISKAVNWQGGGSFLYLELAKNNQTALEKIESAESYEELMAFFEEMYERYFLNYNLKIREFKETVSKEEAFKRLSLVRQKEIFGKMLDLNQLYVNRSEMEDSRYGLNANDIAVTNDFYGF